MITLTTKKSGILKSVINDFYFCTKLTGVKANDIKKLKEKFEEDEDDLNINSDEDEEEQEEDKEENNNKKNKKKNNKRRRIRKRKKRNISDNSYISVSSDYKNILVSNNKFKDDFMNNSDNNIKNKGKDNKNKRYRNNTTTNMNNKSSARAYIEL